VVTVAIAATIAIAAAGVAAVLALGGVAGESPRLRAAAPQVDRFDSGRAWAELRRQVALGPRPAGSRTLRRLARRLRRKLPAGRFELVPGHARLRNIVGRLPGTKPALAIAAHYDTKRLPGFVGANDGAAGTAAVLELARALAKTQRPAGAPELRFLLFDGEEATDDERPFSATGLRGATAYARRHARGLRALVLLDFVAAKELRIVREANSDGALWSRLRAAARAVGAGAAFPAGTGGAITDDHSPFLARGVPAIDLIQWPYDCWHRRCDDLGAVSERSLDLSGESVLALVRTLSR
jgi:glutaminyl-peptide cyclotransferase